MKKLLLMMMFVLMSGCSLFEDDIVFISPKAGASVSGTLTIELDPKHDDVEVRVWIENSTDTIVWTGTTLTSANNYKTTVDVSGYAQGKYEINATYYKGGEDYDGDVDFWID